MDVFNPPPRQKKDQVIKAIALLFPASVQTFFRELEWKKTQPKSHEDRTNETNMKLSSILAIEKGYLTVDHLKLAVSQNTHIWHDGKESSQNSLVEKVLRSHLVMWYSTIANPIISSLQDSVSLLIMEVTMHKKPKVEIGCQSKLSPTSEFMSDTPTDILCMYVRSVCKIPLKAPIAENINAWQLNSISQ